MILVIISIFVVLVWAKIEGGLRYNWRWHVIPNYIFRYDESQGRWMAGTLFNGLLTTIRICIYATVFAVILGTILGVARCSQTLVTRMLARTYVEVLRNVPPVVVIFIFFFFLSEQIISALNVEGWARGIARQENNGIWLFFFGDMRQFPSLVSGVMVLALFESAFIGEIIRAGIQSIPKGQTEAAQSLGMGTLDLLRFIILPQAIHKVLPPLASQFITLIKDSTIISLISVHDLTYSTVELVVSTHAIFEAWLSTAAMYFLLCFGMSLFFRRLEKRGP
ncbi:amino acid ABC transporter permease [Mesorhizobium sp. M1142]|uniref:amino acid ABC transporter permease n=1 Tax=Mesorhizobium sp. M1142 TaxID=2957060 RepID=UPI00333633EF